MADDASNIVARIIEKLRLLRPKHLGDVERLVDSLAQGSTFEVDDTSDIATADFCDAFGDLLIQHHLGSSAPFSKDKFEYAMVQALNESGHDAKKSATGKAGDDLTVDRVPWSLKTQADRNLKAGEIHISKFMELGKGNWTDEADLAGLRDRMFHHMGSYERIFTLRTLAVGSAEGQVPYIYELVEIPKALLMEAEGGTIAMHHASRQTPKPGECKVWDRQTGKLKFELYFDGGTERKLQVRKLNKRYCMVHVTWTFIPGS